MGVGLDLAGRSVRCPHCQDVVQAPVLATTNAAEFTATPTGPSLEPQFPDMFDNVVPREGAESIFADPEESDDSVFSAFEMKAPLLPSPVAPTPTTAVNVATMPVPIYAPAIVPPPQPVAPPVESFDTFENTAGSDEPRDRTRKSSAAKSQIAFDWKTLALIALAGYAVLVTGVAAWGWLRTPAVHDAAPVKRGK